MSTVAEQRVVLPLFGGGVVVNRHVDRGPSIEKQRRERERVLDFFEREYGMTKLAAARKIAERIAVKRGTVTVADVHDEFVQLYGEQLWQSEHGTTHWTGAIFRRQPKWECAGVGPSKHNHSYDNRQWRLRA